MSSTASAGVMVDVAVSIALVMVSVITSWSSKTFSKSSIVCEICPMFIAFNEGPSLWVMTPKLCATYKRRIIEVCLFGIGDGTRIELLHDSSLLATASSRAANLR